MHLGIRFGRFVWKTLAETCLSIVQPSTPIEPLFMLFSRDAIYFYLTKLNDLIEFEDCFIFVFIVTRYFLHTNKNMID